MELYLSLRKLLCQKMQRAVTVQTAICTITCILHPAPVNLHFHCRDFSFFKLNRDFFLLMDHRNKDTLNHSVKKWLDCVFLFRYTKLFETLSWKSFVVILCLEFICTHTHIACIYSTLHNKTQKIHYFVVWDEKHLDFNFKIAHKHRQMHADQISSFFYKVIFMSSRQQHSGQEANNRRHRLSISSRPMIQRGAFSLTRQSIEHVLHNQDT